MKKNGVKEKSRKNNSLKAIALSQIFMFVLSSFAFAFIVSMSFESVSGQDDTDDAGGDAGSETTTGGGGNAGTDTSGNTDTGGDQPAGQENSPQAGEENGGTVDSSNKDNPPVAQTPTGSSLTLEQLRAAIGASDKLTDMGSDTQLDADIERLDSLMNELRNIDYRAEIGDERKAQAEQTRQDAAAAAAKTTDSKGLLSLEQGESVVRQKYPDAKSIEYAGYDAYKVTNKDGSSFEVNANKLDNIFNQRAAVVTSSLGAALTGASKGFKDALGLAGTIIAIGGLVSQFMPEKEDQRNVQAATIALTAGILVGQSVAGALEKALPNWGGVWGFAAGALVAYLILANHMKKTKETSETIEFKCMAWQAPLGGKDCTKCNDDPLKPCSEYRCRSLGQTCKLLNAGTGFERCIDSGRDDVTSPGIKPFNEILTKGYKYTEVVPRPPGTPANPGHMKIVSESGGCLKAFTAFEFGISTTDNIDGKETSQPSQCKIDFNHTAKMDDMAYWMSEDNKFIENHSQTISLPGTDYLNQTFPGIKNDGEYTLYIRCRDGNGNENRDEFAVRFCIDKTPDTTSPVIKSTSPLAGSPILYNADNVSVNVYVNEPSNCRWSRKSAAYSNMENQMQCSNNVWEMNAEFLYTCKTTLTSVKDKQENKFYFRCEDMNKNPMSQSYEYTLFGTQPLTILSTAPNGTIGSSTSVATVNLEVQTDNGYKNGESTCYFSKTKTEKDYIAMSETGGNAHKQSLDLTGGNYTYYLKCVDLGGNSAYSSTNFTVFVDTFAPEVIRAYSAEGKLIIFTDEESKCRYSTDSCNFDLSKDEGQQMPYDFDASRAHFTDWMPGQTYYLKCLDNYDNQPDPAECSFILRPFIMPEEETL